MGCSAALCGHVNMLVPWYCLPNLELLLREVDITQLSEDELRNLEKFDFHHFPAIGFRSINFLASKSAVEILRGIRDGRWTLYQVQQALEEYRTARTKT